MEFIHRSVLLEPTVNALVDPSFGGARVRSMKRDLRSGIFVDGTFGRVHSDSNRNLWGFHPTPARHGGPGLAVIEWYAPEPDPQSHSSL